ncbi:MAG: hypothetical protein ACREBW_08370, partial [Candidatus Micrarchaeaceae archaeon]
MSISLTILGIILICTSLQDVFQTLFHPASHGTMSDWLGKFVWRRFRRFSRIRKGLLTLAGSFSMFTIILTWALLVLLGFTLLYYSQIKTFRTMPGLNSVRDYAFFDAWNVSIASLITITGDITTVSPWMRLAMSLEAVIGFGMLTASVSWLLSIYPVLEARRTLASVVHSLEVAGRDSGTELLSLPETELARTLTALSQSLASIRNQTAQFPITYYFTIRRSEEELAAKLPY